MQIENAFMLLNWTWVGDTLDDFIGRGWLLSVVCHSKTAKISVGELFTVELNMFYFSPPILGMQRSDWSSALLILWTRGVPDLRVRIRRLIHYPATFGSGGFFNNQIHRNPESTDSGISRSPGTPGYYPSKLLQWPIVFVHCLAMSVDGRCI